MLRIRRTLLLGSVAVAGAAGFVLARPAIDRMVRSFRTSSSPGAGVYDVVAGLFMGGYYDDIAAEGAAALSEVGTPAILEIGPGPGHLAERVLSLVPGARWTGVDVDPAMLRATRARLARAGMSDRASLVEGDVASLPFGDTSFDLVLSSLSTHHWADAEAGFREIRRVLRPGATALVYDLPSAWGRVETGSSGIDAAGAVFDGARVGRMRGIGPVTLVSRVEVRRPV